MSMTAVCHSGTVDLATATARLLDGMASSPWGQVSASVYETARLVTHAPWLGGHERRLAYLRRTQRPDGWWVRPDGYGLASTLSAVEALTATILRGGGLPGPGGR